MQNTNFWQKNFIDGTTIIGTDEDVQKGIVSWRDSRNDGIYSVSIGHKKRIVTIKGIGEYWQSDTFSVDYPGSLSILTTRRIMKRLNPMMDNYMRVQRDINKLVVSFSKEPVSGCLVVPWENERSWFVAEIRIGNTISLCYYRAEKKR